MKTALYFVYAPALFQQAPISASLNGNHLLPGIWAGRCCMGSGFFGAMTAVRKKPQADGRCTAINGVQAKN